MSSTQPVPETERMKGDELLVPPVSAVGLHMKYSVRRRQPGLTRLLFGAGIATAGVGFGVLLMLVRLHVGPPHDVDRGVAAAASQLVAAHPPVVTVVEAIFRLGLVS